MSRSTWNPHKIIGIALLFGLFFWFVDSVYHYFAFSELLRRLIVQKPDSLLEPLFLNIQPYQLFVRIVCLVFCLIVGIIVALFVERHKKAEQRIKESEEHYRILTERANDAIGVIYEGKIV
ncbi:MAG TPA: hypothetical protein ENG70_04180 [Candidatus Cloacimonetes bacterium]|nr:hypothetical protein [Candidatus Cloacimonadota bacterium]HEX38041.1 hypothetical protein [Candidatus Cloacimonadota bacterium]